MIGISCLSLFQFDASYRSGSSLHALAVRVSYALSSIRICNGCDGGSGEPARAVDVAEGVNDC